MNIEKTDDPRQVLAILNSLGVVGITASELKTFMKELKLYRKAKEKESQQWEQEIKIKFFQKHKNIKNEELNFYNSKGLKNNISEYNQTKTAVSTGSEKTHNHYLTVIQNKNKLDLEIGQLNRNTETTTSIPIIIEYSNMDSPCKFIQESIEKESLQLQSEIQKEKNSQISENKLGNCSINFRKNSKIIKSTSKSFIRSTTSHLQPKTVLIHKKVVHDPVALYNKYKNIWKKLSLPGDEAHAKLRWTMREKMLGSHPIQKPYIPLQETAKSKIQ